MTDMDRSDHGSALLVTLLTAMLLAGLAGGLTMALMTEEAVEANHRRAVVALYAADGMLTRVVSELARLPDWQPVLDGTYVSSLRVGTATRRLADGSSVDLFFVTDALQREFDEARGAGAARWRLHAWGWFGDLVTDPNQDRRLLVAAWVRGGVVRTTPSNDLEQQQVVLRALAFGPFGTRREVEAVLVRYEGAVRVIAWDLDR